MLPRLQVVDLGRMEYDAAVARQEAAVAAVAEGRLPDLLLLVEHPPVYTFGRGGREENLLLSPEALAAQGALARRTARGGDVTYHGPGQLVGYPILSLDRQGRDLHRYVRGLEEGLIRALADLGVPAGRVPRLTGVWVGEEKIAAIGVAVRRWVTYHGFALNVSVDLDRFAAIIPCGIPDRGVTSLDRLIPSPSWDTVRDAVVRRLADVFGFAVEWGTREGLEEALGIDQ
jgi:lipoyl(octanoyl) transferase